jgi:hypothetical protein
MTILIHKGNDREDPENWRPITITSVLYRVIFCRLAEGLHTVHEEGINLCNKEQKGFVPRRAGCVEHVAVVNALINDAVQKREPIYVLSLDLRDGFGSAPHDLIRRNLNDLGIPENIKNLVIEFYEDAYIQIQTKGGCTGKIEIGKGVKQGCPLSLTLFNIGLDPLLRFLRKNFEEFGYKYYEERELKTKIVKAYADDLLLFANSKEYWWGVAVLITSSWGVLQVQAWGINSRLKWSAVARTSLCFG